MRFGVSVSRRYDVGITSVRAYGGGAVGATGEMVTFGRPSNRTVM